MLNIKDLSEAKRALLAKYMRGNLLKPATNTDSIARRTQEVPAPLSFGQQQLWLLAQLMPDSSVYTECVTIHLPGSLDVAVLEQCYNEILRRHEAWRTSFPLVDGQLVQLVHPASPISLPVVDLRYLPEAEREAEALRLMAEDAQRPFDIANGPLQRATLVCLSDEQHKLFLTLHHIIFDGFSLYQVFLPELRSIYDAFLAGQPSPLPELPIQYSDFAVWQREWVQEQALAEQLSYWKKQLEHASPTLSLPTERPRPTHPTYRGAMHPFALSQQLTHALKDLSHREGVTLYATLVSAFQTLLYRYTQQSDILVGTAISDRKRPELQGLMGYFLNTLVLRSDLSGNPSFRQLLQQVRNVTLEALAHQDVPFEYIVKELQPDRKAGQNPLFQVMISLEPPLTMLPSGWTLTQMDIERNSAKFDLTLELDDRPEGLIGRFVYNTDLFDASTIARMAGHWQTILQSAVTDPAQTIGQLPLLTEAERHQLLVEWNDTAVNYPKDICLHELVEAQVEQTPDAVAVVFEGQHLTYQQLNARANQLAHYLQRMGVGPEVMVGVCMERSLEIVVALLAILKAGGAYVPLDPTYPSERLAFMLEDTQLPVILTQAAVAAMLPTSMAQVIVLDQDGEDWKHIAHEDSTNPASSVTQDNLAYVIYTSGSTGQPKGVMVAHRSICNYILWMQDTYPLSGADGVLQKTAFSFDVSVWEFFWPLTTGARLVLARPEGHKDSAYLVSLIQEQQITTVHFGPAMLSVVLDEPALEQCSSLRQVLCGGEALSYELQERFFARLPVALSNRYGPTEATINATSWHCQRDSKRHVVPIGFPIANTRIYLLDPYGQPVPIGVAGEMYIGGTPVSRGYLNHPHLTAERFVPDSFSSEGGARLYRTGDVARYLPDGAIEFLGRVDQQVKIRGFRIEPGEIEAVLRQHPLVREAVVIAREDTPGDKRLVAYVVPNLRSRTTHGPAENFSLLTSQLHDVLKKQLPDYMLPTSFVMLESLPLTSSGKVDRLALPAPDYSHIELEKSFVAPSTPLEKAVAESWCLALDINKVGIHDNFFSLGGHSLLATKIISHLRTSLGVNVSLPRFFEAPTIAQLAEIITQMKMQGTTSRPPSLQRRSRDAYRVPSIEGNIDTHNQ
jgi:amino acid adenylation domain-containing protein